MINTLLTKDGTQLVPEIESGNVEYKLRLDTKDELGICKIKTQLQWRLYEGKTKLKRSEAIYVFGINDNGTFPSDEENITEKVIDDSINIFENVVNSNNCRISSKNKYVFFKTY